ncbi:hypothetical protein [Brachybacterium sp. YJGR34]|uniref:hypothetical protein n=1 Tax=Brachybacterium sp. YJGR34 TaxID=2059911 RepID=UPI000E0BCF2A|nr:hypothetical protein [Brachybacterium sp. YJGR34]
MITATLAQITAEATAALDGLEVTVTDQPHDAAGAVMAGVPALLILPPDIEWLNYTAHTATWTLWAIAPTTDPTEAVGIFEPILEALAVPLGLTAAAAQTYDIADRTFPGYTLTLTTDH